MKKTLFALFLTVPIFLVSCSTGPSEEEKAQQREQERQQMLSEASREAAKTCEDEVADFAKYPAAVEFESPLQPALSEAQDSQGPSATAYYSANFGIAHFVNGFGVPSEYDFGCITYHDASGKLLSTQVDARKSGLLSKYAYAPHSDTLK